MEEPIRILQVMGSMKQGGAQNFIMNIYRVIDRTKIQFDFIVHDKENDFEEEILSLGGHIFTLEYINKIGPFRYKRQLEKFFIEHSYKIIHVHLNQISGIVLEVAKKTNIPVRIVHSHNTRASGNFLMKAYKKYLGNKIKKYSTQNLACGEKAGKWLFGDNNFEVIINRY